MREQVKKTPEMIAEEKRRIERLCQELIKLTDQVPDRVINGFHGPAVQWKASAIKARKLCESKAPTITKLENALTELRPYYALQGTDPQP